MNSCALQVHSSIPHFSLVLRRRPLVSFVLISHLPCLNNPRSESMGQFLSVPQPLMMVRRAGLELRSLFARLSAALSRCSFSHQPGRTRARLPCSAHIGSYWLCYFFHKQSSCPRWKVLTVILPQYFLELWRLSSIFAEFKRVFVQVWGNGGLRSVERDFGKGADQFVSLTSFWSAQVPVRGSR